MASYPTGGVPPKPASKRRRRNVPTSYGAAKPVTAPAAKETDVRELGFDNPHPLVAQMWETVHRSCEAAFFSENDWARLRLELWYADHTMASGRPSANAWSAIQSGLNEMLLSPAVKRRAGIEVKPQTVDEDENAAVSMTARYQQKLKSV
jgi:hypothetical protein